MKMTGLFYYHDSDEITFIQFYEDGRVTSIGKNSRFDRNMSTSYWHKIQSDKVDYLYGRYWIGEGNRIKIKLEGEYRVDYRGTIKNDDTLGLVTRCQYTNYRKAVTFRRFSEREHIIHLEYTRND
jgi:hypothetical protein